MLSFTVFKKIIGSTIAAVLLRVACGVLMFFQLLYQCGLLMTLRDAVYRSVAVKNLDTPSTVSKLLAATVFFIHFLVQFGAKHHL